MTCRPARWASAGPGRATSRAGWSGTAAAPRPPKPLPGPGPPLPVAGRYIRPTATWEQAHDRDPRGEPEEHDGVLRARPRVAGGGDRPRVRVRADPDLAVRVPPGRDLRPVRGI